MFPVHVLPSQTQTETQACSEQLYFCSWDSFTLKPAIPSYIILREFVLCVRTVIRVLLVDICVTDFSRDAVELSVFYIQRLKF